VGGGGGEEIEMSVKMKATFSYSIISM